MTSASKILENANIAGIIGRTDVQVVVQKLAEKGVRCRTCTSGNPAYRYMDEILDDLEHGATKFGASYSAVVTGFKQGENFTEGAMFVAEAVKKYADDFPSNSVFEFTAKTTADNIRRVDVKVFNELSGKDIFYEFKSVESVPPSGFAAQFVKDMDLPDVTDLNQIRWWFDSKKVSSLPKQQFLDQLSNNPPSAAEVIESLRLKYAPDGNDWLDIVDVIAENFEQIFRVK